MSDTAKKTGEPSFEQSMERLDEIVSSMENERMSLEEMVHSYEEGVALLRSCRQRIDAARRRVEIITADLDGSKATLAPFEPDNAAPSANDLSSEDDDDKPKPRRRKTDSASDDIRLF